MPQYLYRCKCGHQKDVFKGMSECHSPEYCDVCGDNMDRVFDGCGVSVIGTRDSFGIKNVFTNENGVEIDSFKKWEQAGYKDAKDVHKGDVLEKIKRKEDKIKFDKKEKFSVKV